MINLDKTDLTVSDCELFGNEHTQVNLVYVLSTEIFNRLFFYSSVLKRAVKMLEMPFQRSKNFPGGSMRPDPSLLRGGFRIS